jgi:hypothetical protein
MSLQSGTDTNALLQQLIGQVSSLVQTQTKSQEEIHELKTQLFFQSMGRAVPNFFPPGVSPFRTHCSPPQQQMPSLGAAASMGPSDVSLDLG